MFARLRPSHPDAAHHAVAGAYIGLMGVVLLLSSVTLVIKYVLQQSGLHPMGLASARVVVAFAFFLVTTAVQDWRGLVSLRFADVLTLTFLGILGVFSYAIAACGLMRTSVTHYALIYSLLPCCTAALSMMVGKDQPGLFKLVGMGLSLLGCVIAISDGTAITKEVLGSGDLLVLLFTVMMSGHIVASSNIVRRFGAMVANTVMFGNSAVLLCLTTFGWGETPLDTFSNSTIVALLYIGLATAGVFVLRFRSLQVLSPATVGTYHNFIPIVTILMAWLFLGESLGTHTVLGGITVLAGAELVRRTRPPSLPWIFVLSKNLFRRT